MSKIPLTKTAKRPIARTAKQLHYDVVSVADLSAEAYKILCRLNLGKDGLMQSDLMAARQLLRKHPKERDKAVCAIAHSPTRGIVGWGMLFNDTSLRILRSRNNPRTIDFLKSNSVNWSSHFYVKRAFRGCGVGTELLGRLSLVRRRFHTYKYSPQSTGFFKKNGR